MDPLIFALLIGAGIFAGIVNAIAGGSTLVTFPALLTAGLSPIVANASNALALIPGNLMAAFADRSLLPRRSRRLASFVAISLGGGFAGAFLLLATEERLFTQMVPLLIGGATILYAFAPRLTAVARARATAKGSLGKGQETGNASRAIPWVMVPACIYGGYFGAGLGIILITVFTLCGIADVRQANALKNLSSACCSLSSVSIFILRGVISWPETAVMFSGAVIGGFIGVKLIDVLPAGALRLVVIAAGAGLSIVYIGRYWF